LYIDELKLTPNCIRNVFKKYHEEINRIAGYQALAVISENGKMLASDQKKSEINLSQLVGDMDKLFSSPDRYEFLNINKGEVVTLHKQDSIVLIIKPKKETIPRIRLIGVTSVKGNWFYLKMNLLKILDGILIA